MARIRTFRGPSAILILGMVGLLIVLGLPIFLLAASVFVLYSAFSNRSHRASGRMAEDFDPRVSPVIDNKTIGPYRLRKDDNDPDVIEVLDRP